MKRVILTMLTVMLPLGAAAQDPAPGRAGEGLVLAPPQTAAREAAAVQAAGAPSDTRRRPSMVGYVNDSTIENRFRIRFDAGTGLNAADRAEFFYAKCGCYRALPAGDPAYDPDAPGPGPAVITSANFQQLYVWGEYAVNTRLSLIGELPVRFFQPQTFLPGTGSFDSTSGLADIRAGAKLGLSSSSTSQLTLQVLAATPSGNSQKGLGSARWSFEPTLLYGAQFAERFGLEAQFGAVFPSGGSAGVPTSGADGFSGNVLYYGFGPSIDLYSRGTTRIAPVIELVGWYVMDGFSTAEGAIDGLNIVNLKIGGRVVVGERNSFYAGYGHALTDAVWYDDVLRFEYRVGF